MGTASEIRPRQAPGYNALLKENGFNGIMASIDPARVRNFPPGEGCVVLGGENTEDKKRYVTRYCVQHKRQREDLCMEVLSEEWLPCCSRKGRASWKKALYSVFSSETVLFTLHMFTIFLGAFKVSHPAVTENKDLELIHSVIELLVTCLLVIVRTVIGWVQYQEVKQCVYEHEHVQDKTVAKGRHMKMWLVLYTASSAFLLLFAVITFICFYTKVHLGWTILSNQFVLIAIISTSGLFTMRIDITLRKLREDQHKAIIYESVLLMKEGYVASTAEDKAKYLARANAFTEALMVTPMFVKPEYIDVNECYRHSVASLDKVEILSQV